MTTINGIEVLATLEERVAPQHTALLVVDMQNDYCSPGGASDRNGRDVSAIQQLVPPMRKLIDSARSVGIPVIWAKYTLGPGPVGRSGPEILRRGHNFANVDATIKGTWGHDIIAALPCRPDEDQVFEKRRLSCFVGTELDLCLRGRAIKSLVVTGVVTQGCVETTVRDAACYDYYIAVPRDCVASTSLEAHETSLKSMATFLRYEDAITSSERICTIWAAHAAAQREPTAARPA